MNNDDFIKLISDKDVTEAGAYPMKDVADSIRQFAGGELSNYTKQIRENLENLFGEDKARVYQRIVNMLEKKEQLTDEIQYEIDYYKEMLSISQNYISNKLDLESGRSVMPDTLTLLGAKLPRELTKDFINTGVQNIKIVPDKPDSIIKAELKNESIMLPDGYTKFDLFVNFAVISCFQTGDRFITPTKVFKVLTAKTEDSIRLTPDNERQIEDSLQKNATTWIKINYMNQTKYYPLEGEYEPLEGNLLYLEKQRRIINGKEVEGYEILHTPILYKYSQITNNQIIKVPMKYLDTKPSKGNDISYKPTTITIKLYITDRIEQAKKGKLSNKILYDTLFDDCNITYSSNKQRLAYISSIRKILDGFIRTGYITSYTETTKEKSRTLTGFSVNYSK